MKLTKTVLPLFLILFSPAVRAGEENLFGTDTPAETRTEPKTKAVFSGVFDVRLIKTGEAENWGVGGTGLSQYGAGTQGPLGGQTNPTTAFKVPRISLMADILVHNKLKAHFQLNYDDHVDTKDSSGKIGFVEAFVSPDFGDKNLVRLGLLIPPVSLEHPNAGWNTLYTLTPSAINTWIGEELRMLALEATHTFSLTSQSRLNLLLAAYSGGDPLATVLSLRGWALHDYQYKFGDRIHFQPDINPAFSSSGWGTPSKEIDGRLGLYSKLTYEFDDQLKVEAFYLNAGANSTSVDLTALDNDYAWKTSFWQFAVKWQPTADLTFISQALSGQTEMGDAISPAVFNTFHSWFALFSYKINQHRVSARHDYFEVIDKDPNADKNDQKGFAQTVAYFYQLEDHELLGAEFVHIVARRDGNTGLSANDAADDLLQLSYRCGF